MCQTDRLSLATLQGNVYTTFFWQYLHPFKALVLPKTKWVNPYYNSTTLVGGAVLECPVQIHFQNSGFIALFDFPICSLRKSRIGLSDADDDVSRQSLSIGQLGQPVPTQIAAQKSNSIWWLHKSDTGTLLHRPATLYKSLLSWHPIILITYVCYVYTEVAGHCVLTETVPSCCDKYERNWHFLKAKLKRKNWDINILFLRDEYRWLYGWLLQTQNC